MTYRLESRECRNPHPQDKNGVAGYTGFHAGEGFVVGRSHQPACSEADRTMLPKLRPSKTHDLDFYYGDSSLNMRNRSSMVWGDPRSVAPLPSLPQLHDPPCYFPSVLSDLRFHRC